MDMITPTEGLVSMLVERGNVDGTNAIQLLRTAQDNLVKWITDDGKFTAINGKLWLATEIAAEKFDDVVIAVTHNGGHDIFTPIA